MAPRNIDNRGGHPMEVGTMKKTEYLALNPSVDPDSVSEFDLARFAFLSRPK